MAKIIPEEAIKRRNIWIHKIGEIKGDFASNSDIIKRGLSEELSVNGISSLLDHLRLCGNIPEPYGRDTSEEKQYSKYTDSLLAFAYRSIGLKSCVITERADVAEAEDLLFNIFKTVPALNPSKSAVDYWLGVNKTILGHYNSISELWQDEKIAATESIEDSQR